MLEVRLTVEDPDTFYEPWQAVHRYRRTRRPRDVEQVCAENNQVLFDNGTPVAGKRDFLKIDKCGASHASSRTFMTGAARSRECL